MSDTPVPAQLGQEHQQMRDAVVFGSNLDEVFLLLDFISGRPEKQLSTLTVPDPEGGDNLKAHQVVKKLAQIRYPALPARSPADQAADASFLLLAKDSLAALAHPARGMTIAYTALFSRIEKPDSSGSFWTRWLPGQAAKHAQPQSHAARRSLAESAFPGLSAQVWFFSVCYKWLMGITIFWLILTTFAYWDVAMSRSTLQRIDQIHKDRAALYQASADFALTDACKSPQLQQAVACRRYGDLASAESEAMKDLQTFRDCSGFCAPVLHVVRWSFILCGVHDQTMQKEASIVSLVSVFSNFVLPMMFGVLGTFVAAIRLVQFNVRESILSPRDLWSTLLSLPLGMVAGVAVGLFYSPASAPGIGGGISAVDLTMTTSGLGFLAGYGSQTFFDLLDSLKKNAFKLNGDIPKPKPST